jgi:hypothetical protein
MHGLTIPYEVADGIAVAVLQDHLKYLKEEVRLHLEEGKYLHPEDLDNSLFKLIPSLEIIIPYFGGKI